MPKTASMPACSSTRAMASPGEVSESSSGVTFTAMAANVGQPVRRAPGAARPTSVDFDLTQVVALLSTTRAVRKRLDFDRPVPDDVLLECLRLAIQAPTGSNSQNWRWLIIGDQAKKDELGRLYNDAGGEYLRSKAGEGEA